MVHFHLQEKEHRQWEQIQISEYYMDDEFMADAPYDLQSQHSLDLMMSDSITFSHLAFWNWTYFIRKQIEAYNMYLL